MYQREYVVSEIRKCSTTASRLSGLFELLSCPLQRERKKKEKAIMMRFHSFT